MITYLDEEAGHVPAREMLLDRAFGPARFLKSSQRIRDGRMPADGLSLVAVDGSLLVGTVRLWHVTAWRLGAKALLLGPLAVADDQRGAGIGAALMRIATARAAERGHGAILLVGDPAYYERFGFSAASTGGLAMPGPFERHRLLALELKSGALTGAAGVIRPAGERLPVDAAVLAA
jgi:predicted N-acetyltransferase YhbS